MSELSRKQIVVSLSAFDEATIRYAADFCRMTVEDWARSRLITAARQDRIAAEGIFGSVPPAQLPEGEQ